MLPHRLVAAFRRAPAASPACEAGDATPAIEQKASRTAALFALASTGRAAWTPRDYRALAREGYQRNPVVHRAVRMVAEAAASVPLLLYEDGRELGRHPLLDLLARPNAAEGRAAFLERIAAHLLISGNAYVEQVGPGGRPRELHVLRPDRMTVTTGRDGWPSGYLYAVDGRSVRFEESGTAPAPILHLKLFHPLDDHYGLGPLEAAQVGLDIHNAASAWNKALLDNAARPSGALVYKGESGLSEEQFERLRRELADGYEGAANAGRPLLLEGGLDWKSMSLTPRDMDFLEAKNGAARDVALAFGVPPMLLGIPGDATYANYREASRAFWRQTVMPLVGHLAGRLCDFLAPAWGGGLALVPDPDQVSALAGERGEMWDRIEAAGFLTINEKRAALGYPPIEGGDRLVDAGPATGGNGHG